MVRAAAQIERYGGAIRADLKRYYGVDMLDFFRSELSAEALLDYLDHLPRNSAYVAALADDDELAEHAQPPKRTGPSLTEWSPEVEKLTLIADRLAEAVNAINNTVAKRPRRPPRPSRRPVTAYDRLLARRRRATHEHIKDMVRPAPGRRTMADPPEGGEIAAATHSAARPRRRARPQHRADGDADEL